MTSFKVKDEAFMLCLEDIKIITSVVFISWKLEYFIIIILLILIIIVIMIIVLIILNNLRKVSPSLLLTDVYGYLL